MIPRVNGARSVEYALGGGRKEVLAPHRAVAFDRAGTVQRDGNLDIVGAKTVEADGQGSPTLLESRDDSRALLSRT
jgi:hypothetical protein